MATKTITLELDAYQKLVQARTSPKESFTNVIRRAHWNDLPPTAGEILTGIDALVRRDPDVLLSREVLDEMANRRRSVRRNSRWDEK